LSFQAVALRSQYSHGMLMSRRSRGRIRPSTCCVTGTRSTPKPSRSGSLPSASQGCSPQPDPHCPDPREIQAAGPRPHGRVSRRRRAASSPSARRGLTRLPPSHLRNPKSLVCPARKSVPCRPHDHVPGHSGPAPASAIDRNGHSGNRSIAGKCTVRIIGKDRCAA
jgi:hypothetical protein